MAPETRRHQLHSEKRSPPNLGVTLTLDPVLLHSVCRLLQAAVKKSDWDMELKLPGVEPQEVPERAGRTIN